MLHVVSAFDRIGEENAFAVLAKAADLQARGRDVINLGIGQPDFKTPAHIVEAAVKALHDGEHGYTAATGIKPLREAVAADLHKRHNVEVSPDSVLIVPGGKVTMHMAILMFGEPGVDILYPDPGFPIYRSMIEFTGARPIPVPMREENGFAFSAEETLALMTPRTRLVILNSPANPTGGVTPKAEIDKLVAGLARYPDVAILSDEIYGQMSYDGLAHQTLLAYPEIRDRLILLDGWSKTYAMTGWRLGYSIWPAKLYDAARKLAVNSYSCVNAPTQYAGLAALTGPQDAVARHGRRVRCASAHGRRRPQCHPERARRDAEGRVLRLPQHLRDGLEGQAARQRVVGDGGCGDHRRAGFRRLRRGLPASLLCQQPREHRPCARPDRAVPRSRNAPCVTFPGVRGLVPLSLPFLSRLL